MEVTKEKLPSPDGTKPMMISMREMEILGLKTGSGLRETVPFKVFDKATIMEQITQMGFMCPFHEYRNELSKLEGTEVLIVADPQEMYGDNWLLCFTRKALEVQMDIIQQKEKLELEAENSSTKEEEVDFSKLEYEDKPILAKAWDSSTAKETCDQVNRLNIKSTRPLVKVSVTRWSDEFNADCKFSDRDADQCFVEWRQHKDPNYELTRMEQDIGLQGIPQLVDNSTQTSWFRQVNSALQYTSLVMDCRSKQAEMDSEKLHSFLDRAVGHIEEALQQNETLDIFLDPFSNLHEEETSMSNKNENNIKEIRSFTDLVYSKNKTLPSIDWHPKKNGIIAVAAAANVNFSKRLDLLDKIDSSYILIWNFVDLIHPQLMLEAPQDVMTLRFNPSQPHIIAGGLYNGQVLVWDFSKAELHMNKKKTKDGDAKSADGEGQKQMPPVKPVHVSYIDASHRRPVSDLYWLPPGMEINSRGHVATTNETSVNQFVTIAGDGQVCFWDLRFKEPKYRCTSRLKAEKIANKDASPDIHFTPIYSISLNKTDSSGELGLKSFSFEKQKEESDNNSSFSSRFYCGTEEGEFVYADWRPHAATKSVFSKDDENGNGEEGVQYVQWVHRDHFRPIINVSFSPFFPSISMTVGETSFHLWNTAQNKGAEGNSPIFISPLSLTAITCAAFSPSRPGVIYIGKADGNLEVWDFLDQSHKASLSVGVTACALTSIEFRPVVSNSNGVINPTVASGTGATKSGIAAGKSSNNANTNVNLKQQLVAVGDQNGNLHILEIPRTLARGPSGERQAMEAYFKRESERLKCRYDSAAAATGVTGAKTNSANTRDEPVVQPTKNSNNEKEPSEDELFKRMEIEFRKELGIEAA